MENNIYSKIPRRFTILRRSSPVEPYEPIEPTNPVEGKMIQSAFP